MLHDVRFLQRAIVAGILGGILVDAFLIVTRSAPFPGIYQFVASGLVGKVAFTSSAYVWLGVVLHFMISIVWASLYAYLIVRKPGLNWIAGGIVFGFVVFFAMQAVTVLAHVSAGGAPSARDFAFFVVAHCLFFGLPVSWYVSRTTAQTAARSSQAM